MNAIFVVSGEIIIKIGYSTSSLGATSSTVVFIT